MDNDDMTAGGITPKESSGESGKGVWRILSVDDEPIVHEMTKLVLRRVTILDKDLALDTAQSAGEAIKRIRSGNRYAVALVDIVMETDDAGLRLIKDIRDSGYDEIRLIIRTGQPGYLADQEVMDRYDVEGYALKTNLTRKNLIELLTNAIEAYAVD